MHEFVANSHIPAACIEAFGMESREYENPACRSFAHAGLDVFHQQATVATPLHRRGDDHLTELRIAIGMHKDGRATDQNTGFVNAEESLCFFGVEIIVAEVQPERGSQPVLPQATKLYVVRISPGKFTQ